MHQAEAKFPWGSLLIRPERNSLPPFLQRNIDAKKSILISGFGTGKIITFGQLNNAFKRAVVDLHQEKFALGGAAPIWSMTADFDFDVKAANGTQRIHLTRNVESEFDEWYRSSSSTAFGSSFVFEQLFAVQGDTSMIQSVAVSLTNGQGSTSSAQVPIASGP